MGQFASMVVIAHNEALSQEELSEELHLEKSTTARVIQQLLTSEYITRETDAKDKRIFRLQATQKAQDILPEIEQVVENCHTILTSELTEIERELFLSLLAKVEKTAVEKLRD